MPYAHNIFTFRRILLAYQACLRGKSNTINAIRFGYKLEQNIAKLAEELNAKTYLPGRSVCFVTQDPVIREIFAADFRDRVIQHLLMREIESVFEKRFIFNSFACRKEKGALLGVAQLQKGIQSVTDNFQKKAHYFKGDISGFFMSIDKTTLFEIAENTLKKEAARDQKLAGKLPDILWLARTIIFHDPTKNYIRKGNSGLFHLVPKRKSLFYSGKNKGLPIGNLTSQFFANVYLNEFDHFVKRTLKCQYYYRYVDDFVLLARETKTLKKWRGLIKNFLNEQLKLTIHPRKQTLQPLRYGIDFVGYRIHFYHSLVRNRTVRKLKKRLWQWNEQCRREKPTKEQLEKIISTVNSYFGLLRHADTFRLRRHLYEQHFGALKEYFTPANKQYEYFRIIGDSKKTKQ